MERSGKPESLLGTPPRQNGSVKLFALWDVKGEDRRLKGEDRSVKGEDRGKVLIVVEVL